MEHLKKVGISALADTFNDLSIRLMEFGLMRHAKELQPSESAHESLHTSEVQQEVTKSAPGSNGSPRRGTNEPDDTQILAQFINPEMLSQ